jgi:hypothetical protein
MALAELSGAEPQNSASAPEAIAPGLLLWITLNQRRCCSVANVPERTAGLVACPSRPTLPARGSGLGCSHRRGHHEQWVLIGRRGMARRACRGDKSLGATRAIACCMLAGESEAILNAKAEPALILTPPKDDFATHGAHLNEVRPTTRIGRRPGGAVRMQHSGRRQGRRRGTMGLARALFYAKARAGT